MFCKIKPFRVVILFTVVGIIAFMIPLQPPVLDSEYSVTSSPGTSLWLFTQQITAER